MSKIIRIVPAVLTENPQELANMLNEAVKYTEYVQIDIMDGRFVPSHSITWQDIEIINPRPAWEVHLMVQDPERELAGYQRAGASKAVFHFEATNQPLRVIEAARALKFKVGLAINPGTTIEAIKPLVKSVDSILFLSVNPGFYGAPFIPEVLNKVKELRSLCPDLLLSIDGGINAANLRLVAESGVNEICVGSGIFRQPNPAEAYRNLTSLVNS